MSESPSPPDQVRGRLWPSPIKGEGILVGHTPLLLLIFLGSRPFRRAKGALDSRVRGNDEWRGIRLRLVLGLPLTPS